MEAVKPEDEAHMPATEGPDFLDETVPADKTTNHSRNKKRSGDGQLCHVIHWWDDNGNDLQSDHRRLANRRKGKCHGLLSAHKKAKAQGHGDGSGAPSRNEFGFLVWIADTAATVHMTLWSPSKLMVSLHHVMYAGVVPNRLLPSPWKQGVKLEQWSSRYPLCLELGCTVHDGRLLCYRLWWQMLPHVGSKEC